ncbi:MAG TPA: MAB_1171c family putative transporter [Streptomyces sp.]|uniref:MAB_1171c family putative transporter n=1 Tax=Streptomyces sp. TaxID=1931 RepID=UPI002D2292D7|nr:MAB_1171c family putative transporter [Streptomyces sp.]HZG06197.1 MAB_1171c family putative transporter [Streptomyces sp.]
MSLLLTLYGAGSLLALAWLAYRLTRAPRDVPLWAVTGLIACWAVAYPFGLAADRNEVFWGLAPMTSRLVQHLLVLAAVNCMVYFYLFSALPPARARRRAAWYGLALLAAAAVLTAAAAATPEGVRTRDHTVTSVAVFFVTADVYLAAGFALGWVWTRRYARRAEPRLARGLRITSVGMAAIVVANALFVPAVLMRWAGGDGAHESLDTAGAAETTLGWFGAVFFLLPGIVLILVGIIYPAAVMRLTALRVWWRHLRAYRGLAPLWTALHRHFPEDALHRVPVRPWRDALSLRGVHRRYYRRVIECRDGLVRVSPYLAALDRDSGTGAGTGGPVDADPRELARRLREALRAHAAGRPVSTSAVPVVVPDEGDLDADVRQLVALSRALRSVEAGTAEAS